MVSSNQNPTFQVGFCFLFGLGGASGGAIPSDEGERESPEA